MRFEWKPLHDLILHFLCDKNAVRLTADSESEISTIDIFRHYTKWVKIHYFGVEKRTQKEFDDGLHSVVDSRLEAPFVYLVEKVRIRITVFSYSTNFSCTLHENYRTRPAQAGPFF